MCQAATGSKLRHIMLSHIITYYIYYVLIHNAGYMMQIIVFYFGYDTYLA